MHQVLLLGGGKIGRLIAKFLADSGDFRLRVADLDAAALARSGRWPKWKPCSWTQPRRAIWLRQCGGAAA